MPERFTEAVSLAANQEDNTLCAKNGRRAQHFTWADALPIAEFSPNVIFCREERPDEDPTHFVWLTNFSVTRNNVTNIANNGGRLRWKTENEGFNVQKAGW